MESPPVLIRLPPVNLEVGGRDHRMTVAARIFDIGAVSVCLNLEDLKAPAADLPATAFRFAGQRGLAPLFSASLKRLLETLGPILGDRSVDPDFFEDYTIFIADRPAEAIDPVALLLGEEREFSQETRADILKNSLSYGCDDLTVLSWDTALLIGPEPPGDLIELLEFANVQALEFRYYDRVLTEQMGRMYDDIEAVDRRFFFRRIGQYHAIMTRLMETHAEISEITEKVDNLIKTTNDVYYARVYGHALTVLRISQWRASVNRRIDLIRQNYMMLSDEVNIRHSNFLEFVVILLIALEVVFLVWEQAGTG